MSLRIYRECYAVERAARLARTGASSWTRYLYLLDLWLKEGLR